MADGVQFKLEGVDALQMKLKGLSNDLQYKGGRAALRKAANIVRDAAIAGAETIDDHATASHIAKNIVVRWSSKLFKQTGDLGFRIGVLGGARQTSQAYKDLGIEKGRGKDNPGGDTFYWRFIEFGVHNAFGKGIDIPARPFMRPALENNADKAISTFIEEWDKSIDRVLKRAAMGK